MKWLLKQGYLTKYIISITLLFIFLIMSRIIMPTNANLESFKSNDILVKNLIEDVTESYKISVNYPKFRDKKINKIVTDWLYDYIKDFKNSSSKLENTISTLSINYELYFVSGHVNIFFDIDNSINLKDISKNILINLNTSSSSSISEIYSEDVLNESISKFKEKYPSYVNNVINENNLEDFEYLIDDEGFTIILNNFKYDKYVSYIPQVRIDFSKNVNEYIVDGNSKMVALTFDDGPSVYSEEILKCLKLNNAKATFFELGTSMNSHRNITKLLYDSGMEIGNHTYSHKYLTKLSTADALEQINSVSILFNEITGSNINLMRAPYGSVNQRVRESVPFPLISWSIDTKDWLHKNAEISAPIVLDYITDGDIVLMHDIHYPTIELVKIIVPELKSRGYELVTVSELAKYKNHTLEPGVVTREIKNIIE